jgi:hypothetical protein
VKEGVKKDISQTAKRLLSSRIQGIIFLFLSDREMPGDDAGDTVGDLTFFNGAVYDFE